jgi:peptidoglycan/xylan/chitin deacetylase (PgdA/CDA1 family)
VKVSLPAILRVLIAVLLAFAVVTARAQPAPAEYVAAAANEVITNFRRQIVLHEAATASRALTQAGQYLFFRNRQLITQLVDYLAQPPLEQTAPRIAALLELLDTRGDWLDIDRIALLGVINETRLRLPIAHPLAARLTKAREDIIAVRNVYNLEVTAALAGRAAGGAGARPEWNAYTARIREQYPVARILDELKPALADPTPGRADPRAARALDDEWSDGRLPPKTVLLTFDDGPHPQFTVEILQILAHYGIRAIFFEVGQNLGAAGDGRLQVTRNAGVVAEILRGGHAIGNHSFSHPVLPKLAAAAIQDEIDTTQGLLFAAAPGHAPLFRPPYGARNDLVLTEIAERGLRSVLWNIDSRDWADPIPQSIAQRVIDEAEREGRGIILFHDIHGRSVQALPIAIEGLRKRGFRFAHWDRDSGALVVDAAPAAQE